MLLHCITFSLKQQSYHKHLQQSTSQPVEVVLRITAEKLSEENKNRVVVLLVDSFKQSPRGYSPVAATHKQILILFIALPFLRAFKVMETA